MHIQRTCRWILLLCGAVIVTGSAGKGRIEAYRRTRALEYANHWLAVAKNRGQEKKLEAAAAAIRKALEKAPTYGEGWVSFANLGVLYQQQGQTDKALSIYREVVKRLPDLPSPYINIGIIYYNQRRYDSAAAFFENAVRILPDDMEARLGLAQAYEKLGRNKDAVRVLLESLQNRPDSDLAYHILGRNLRKIGNLDAAVKAYRKALELNPKNPGVLNSLAVAYIQQARLTEAHAVLAQLVGRFPGKLDFRMNLCVTLLNLKKHEAALEQCRQILKIDPNNTKAYALMGEIFTADGKRRRAAAAYREILKRDPDNQIARQQLKTLTGGRPEDE